MFSKLEIECIKCIFGKPVCALGQTVNVTASSIVFKGENNYM